MSRLTIAAGLLVGVVAAALVLAGMVALAPDPVTSAPPSGPASASPSPAAIVSSRASGPTTLALSIRQVGGGIVDLAGSPRTVLPA